ncbi:MAG: VCBS repeat-containing protein [Nanoarchaeota archaeon]|nr:VCBS repeat-containing protein [Nanoarchaeota archaeon]
MHSVVASFTLICLAVLVFYAFYLDVYLEGNNFFNTPGSILKIIDISGNSFIVYNPSEEVVEEVFVKIDDILVDLTLFEPLQPMEAVSIDFSQSFFKGVNSELSVVPAESSIINSYNKSSYLYYNNLCNDGNYCTRDYYFNESCSYEYLSNGSWFGCYDTVGCSDNGLGELDCSCINGVCTDSCGNNVCESWENSITCLNDCNNCRESASNCLSPNVWFYGGVETSDGFYCACCGDDGFLDNFTNGSFICSRGKTFTDADENKLACEFMGFKWAVFNNINYTSVITVSNFFSRAYSIHVADVDGDGDMDIIGSNLYSEIGWWRNDGNNTWTPNLVSSSYSSPYDVNSGDMDGDGDIDIIAVSESTDKVILFENLNGVGTSWSELVVYNMLDGASSVQIADLDKDGDMDIISGALNGNRIAWFENLHGWGATWEVKFIDNLFTGTRNIIVEDINKDNNLDVISASEFTDRIVWWTYNGSEWIRKLISDDFNGVKSIALGDLDDDGDLDIVANSYYDNYVAWLENINNCESWVKHVINNNAVNYIGLSVNDLDLDGDLDILATSQGDMKLIVLLNEEGEFVENIISNNFPDSFEISSADFDKDGDLEIMSASYTLATISIWDNNAITGVNGPCCGDDHSLDNFNSSASSCINGVLVS